MASLVTPPTYLSVAALKAQPNDYDLTPYTDAQLQDLLVRASGKANSILRRNLLAEEVTVRILGDGTNKLEIRKPLLYIKRVQIAVPGSTGMYVPLDQILVDYTSGSVLEYTPMLWNGLGYFARFPSDIPVDVTLGSGYGFNPYKAPNYTTQDGNGNLTPGTYNLAITTQTMNGETTANVRQVSTVNGAITANISETLGAYLYRAYLSPAANNTTLSTGSSANATSFSVGAVGTIAAGDVLLFDSGANAEALTVATASGTTITTTTGAQFAHSSGVKVIPIPKLVAISNFTAYGTVSMSITVSSLTATQGLWQDNLPTVDTSAPDIPPAITEAVSLLALSRIYEQNNLANRGVYRESNLGREVMWRSTEGTSGTGTPLMEQQARLLLAPFSLQAIF